MKEEYRRMREKQARKKKAKEGLKLFSLVESDIYKITKPSKLNK